MNFTVETTVETRIMDAKTGKQVGGNAPKKNLVLDGGLNALARSGALGISCFPAQATQFVLIGSGNTANSINSGAVTFTQSGTTLTASGSFFTSGMVGCIFKYGTGSGGTEIYITAFTSATQVTVGTSATVAVPTVGTVWFVQQTALQTLLFTSQTYQTNAGDNGTTISGNTATHKRTVIFAQQGSPYTVNEIGYAPQLSSNHIIGRIVLSSSDVVGTSNFYVVVISVTVTYSPANPLSVSNVGTNINTAGTLAIEGMNIVVVSSNGTTAGNPSSAVPTTLDNAGLLVFKTATYTQNGSINSSSGISLANTITIGGSSSWTNDNTKVGSATLTFSGSLVTTGQTLFGVGIRDNASQGMWFDVLFTTPQTAPTGTFQPNTVWRLTYSRTLVN